MDIEAARQDIEQKMMQAKGLYSRLVLAVGPIGTGKTALLRTVHERTGAPLVNVNLHLSRRLLDLSERARAIRVPRILDEVVTAEARDAETVLLDNTELLFDRGLRQDPLQLLQQLARNRTVVAAWLGCATRGTLTYAEIEHPEYRAYSLTRADGPLITNLEGPA